MPRFLVEFRFENFDGKLDSRKVPSKIVDLPINKERFLKAHLDLEEEAYLTHGDPVSITKIIASEAIPKYEIEIDDIVFLEWMYQESLTDELREVIKKFKPLWGKNSNMTSFAYFSNEHELSDVMAVEYERIISYFRKIELSPTTRRTS